MDIVEIIEKCIDLSIRSEELLEIIRNSKQGNQNALFRADVAYNSGNYEMEKVYDEEARKYKEEVETAEDELIQVEYSLKDMRNIYSGIIKTCTEDLLIYARDSITEKKKDFESKAKEYDDKKFEAKAQADEAYKNKEYGKEREYDMASEKYFIESRKCDIKSKKYQNYIFEIEIEMDNRFPKEQPQKNQNL